MCALLYWEGCVIATDSGTDMGKETGRETDGAYQGTRTPSKESNTLPGGNEGEVRLETGLAHKRHPDLIPGTHQDSRL